MGSPKAMAGTKRAMVAALLTAPKIEMAANIYPKNKLPVSPMNMVAGLKL